jgi:hypothetical protein
MKKSEENRYPNSAELFKFCKEVLILKHQNEVKVIDQHVGALLGFDPADCSHWKKGKKNIKSIQTVNTIATQLEMDSRVVTDLVSGRMALEECLQEFKGYGAYELSSKHYEDLKREFFRNPAHSASEDQAFSFDSYIDLMRNRSFNLTKEILLHSDVKSCPVMLPELVLPAHYNLNLKMVSNATKPGFDNSFEVETNEGQRTLILNTTQTKPHTRALVARELGRILLDLPEQVSGQDDINCARINLFAGMLLVPRDLLQRVCRQLPATSDLAAELASIFWVGRSVINARLKDFLVNGN